MSGLEMFATAGYALVGVAGFVLGMIFGQKLASDVTAMLHAIETRLAGVEGSLSGASSTAALVHHAAATEKLATAINKQAVASEPAAKR
jgi:hypothetical protein